MPKEPNESFLKYGFSVPRETLENLEKYVELLLSWNQKHNLIGKGTVEHIWERHIIDCYQLTKFLPNKNATIIDFGTGAGLPGMILALSSYENVTLIESISKKCDFLHEVKKQLDLPVKILNKRVEEVNFSREKQRRIFTSRAVAALPKLFKLLQNHINEDDILLFQKGANYQAEISAAQKLWKFKFKTFKSVTSEQSVILQIQNLSWK